MPDQIPPHLDELREKVARKLLERWPTRAPTIAGWDDLDDDVRRDFLADATAILALPEFQGLGEGK